MNGVTAGSNIWMGKVTPLVSHLFHYATLNFSNLNAHVNLTVLMLPEAGELKRAILPCFSEHCLVNRIYTGLMAKTTMV